jgi:hypothetical protein
MHSQQHRHLKTNNNISKFAVITLSILLLTGLSLVPAIQLGVYGQVQQQQQSQVNQIPSVLKQQHPNLLGSYFDIDNMTFSHRMASVNGIQMHYIVGGQGDAVVLLHGWPQTCMNGVMLCQFWLGIILSLFLI